MFSVAVPDTHFETSFVMISYYGYEIWRHKSAGSQTIFTWKWVLFELLLTIKVKLADKMKQSTYLCDILGVKHKKLPILAVLTWF